MVHGDLLYVVNQMAEDSGKSLVTIAEEIGKPYSTLKRELNEFDDGAKLGAATLLPLMRACGNSVKPLEYLASRMGHRLVKMSDCESDKPTLAEELLDDLPVLADFHCAMREGKSPEAVSRLLQAAIRDLEQDYNKYYQEFKARPTRKR